MSSEAQLQRYHQLVDTLGALARSSHQIDAVVRTVHQQAGRLIPAHVTLLALLESGGDWRWELFKEEQRFTQRLPYYPGGILEGVLHGTPLSIPDIDAYLDVFPVRVRRLLETEEVLLDIREDAGPPERGTLSMIFVPLEVQGVRAGVLSMQSYATHAFDDTDLQFLELLAQHVSIALDNAALREALERATLTDTLTGLPNRRAFTGEVTRSDQHAPTACAPSPIPVSALAPAGWGNGRRGGEGGSGRDSQTDPRQRMLSATSCLGSYTGRSRAASLRRIRTSFETMAPAMDVIGRSGTDHWCGSGYDGQSERSRGATTSAIRHTSVARPKASPT